jgi:enoyl-CoA hydratase/carnithine racemase
MTPTPPAAPEPSESLPELVIETHDSVRILALNRPRSKNGLTVELLRTVLAALTEADKDSAVRAIILTGEGDSFCSGLDLRAAMELAQRSGSDIRATNEERMRTYFHGVVRALQAVGKPIIALVDGPAAGFGCDLALACDLRIGTARARFGEVFIKRGLMPDGGGTFLLPRIIGLGRALELMFLGDMIDSSAALQLGVLNRIVSSRAEAIDYAQRIAAGPPLVLREVKRAVYKNLAQPFDAALEEEVNGQMMLLQSADFAEGISAFFGKRTPQFSGK